MALDQSLLDAIKGFEGYTATPAWDYKQTSSGYGTRAQPGDEALPPEQLRATHEQRLQDEVAKAAAHVDSVNPNLPAGARNALISLTYNAGPGWSQSGLGGLVKAGDLAGAQARLLEYNKAGGEVNPGLVARRQKEAAWFDGGTVAPANPVASAIMGAPQAPAAAMPRSAGDVANQLMGVPAAPQPQQPATAGGYEPEAPMQLPAIQFPQRRSPNLSKLRALFQVPSTNGRG